MSKYLVLVSIILFSYMLSPALLHAEDATDIVKKSQNAFFYPGKDMQARVKMTLTGKTGQQRYGS